MSSSSQLLNNIVYLTAQEAKLEKMSCQFYNNLETGDFRPAVSEKVLIPVAKTNYVGVTFFDYRLYISLTNTLK